MRAPEGALLDAMYGLADRLKLRLQDVASMPVAEFRGWLAYLENKADARQ